MKHKYFLAAGLTPLVAAAAALMPAATHPAAATIGPVNSPIKHVIEIMVENHTFDNLFGDFPGADGVTAPGRWRRR